MARPRTVPAAKVRLGHDTYNTVEMTMRVRLRIVTGSGSEITTSASP